MAVQVRSGFRRLSVPVLLVPVFLLPATAWAAETSGIGGTAEATFVFDIVLLLVVGRGLGELLQRIGQPAIMGQLIGGILLGPSLFGWLWPSAQHALFSNDPSHKSMIDAVSQLGILLLLLLTGMETDLRLVRRVGKGSFSISMTGIVVPFICGFGLAQFLPSSLLPEANERMAAGMFLGTALSVSSVKIVAIIIREMNFMRRDLGQIIVSSAIIEDTIGWLIIAVTFGIATKGHFEFWPLIVTIIEVAAFMVFSLTVGRRIVFAAIRWTNDAFRSEYAVITAIIVIMGLMALATDAIGVHTVLGAFVAGILVGESPILTEHIEGQLRGLITALFMPVFFGTAGLSADLTVLANPALALLTIGLVLIASIGKFSGAFLGSRLASMSWKEAVAVGSAMNARGSTEVIVASIGLSMNILSHNLFTMIVTMAVITTLVMPPMLRWALGRIPMEASEKERVERETLDEHGFVSSLERLLLVVDDSSVGRFAAYLAGLIGGSRGMPTTLLKLTDAARGSETDETGTEDHLEEIEKGAKVSAEAVEREDDMPVEKVHVTARSEARATTEMINEEARKGYGMLLAGMADAMRADDRFRHDIEEIAKGFSGPLCLVVGSDCKPMLDVRSTIVVPVNGTEVSRGAADFALALARPTDARVKVIYVSRSTTNGHNTSLSHEREEAVLKDVAALAERYGVTIDTRIHTHGLPEDAVFREAAHGASLVVLGVTQRPGDNLFFGDTAMAVLAGTKVPVVLLASERGKSSAS